jgi:hypothetical protein
VARRRRLSALVGVLFVAGILWYLRDPAWLAGVESGFGRWETSGDGVRYRWIAGHASFFVPATASAIVIPARTTFAPGDPPTTVSIAIDDRAADALVLTDDAWQLRRLRMPPPPGSRRLRRIDIRVNRLRGDYRGAQIGEVAVAR